MASRREQIRMSESELEDFLEERRVMSVATVGADGWPHVVALWYAMRDGCPLIWTYGKSQKVKNLERDPRATLMVEEGAAYNELRGVMLKVEAEIERDYEAINDIGKSIYRKYSPGQSGELDEAVAEMVRLQSKKRVAIRFKPVKVVSWDHRKL